MIAVEGTVQGVGFRPYVHRLATARKLDGFVRNDPGGLLISVQGDSEALDDFLAALRSSPPPLAMIREIRIASAAVGAPDGFFIVERTGAIDSIGALPDFGASVAVERRTSVPSDAATCADCLRELFDKEDRRYSYPFINCTHCGPRLTIVERLPYDRPNTTMAAFTMCELCQLEYEDPADRRFHAQPIACPACGPTATFRRTAGTGESTGREAVIDAAAALCRGEIVAIKGLGGYHIACDALNALAVSTLRARKHREARPLAVMVADAAAARDLCFISAVELNLLESRERPIVLLTRKPQPDPVSRTALEQVAPRSTRLGIMLPYTPLHYLLMDAVAGPLVMTSGNLSDEPIAFEDPDARHRLGPLVDAFLGHDRPITTRCDDSVMLAVRGAPAFIRRSRGFAPRPIETRATFPSDVLAVGGQLKNTFCLARDRSAYVSHHIGDLGNESSREALTLGIRHYSALVGVEPEVVAHDLHPDYASTRLAAHLGMKRKVAVQHHHAHVASCMAEHGLVERVIGVVFDGAGLGDDGATWGGEFLLVDAAGYRRLGHLGYVPLPGGDAAARKPIRMAVAHLWNAFGEDASSFDLAIGNRLPAREVRLLRQMLENGVNSPATSSIGRLFDAVAALAGVRDVAQFEGQAAMELEAVADAGSTQSYATHIEDMDSMLIPDPGSLIRAVVSDAARGVDASVISAAFHNGVARMILDTVVRIRQNTGVNRVVLSGGVFQNVLLLTRAAAGLELAGFEVFTQRLVPCNDGGLSLGQAYVVALSDAEA
ncbi:MAG TPA: carbamoyltransferase HypF [Gemmatimonadaceae bacterium]|nr:carbamoyltransferase HypF [Gemmatimonadaceae bacterium]